MPPGIRAGRPEHVRRTLAAILPTVWHRIRQVALYFLLGFTVAFVIYLFLRFNADQVLLGIAVGAAAGLVTAAGLMWLEHQFPDNARR